MAPLRDGDGDSVGRVVPYRAADPAVPLAGDDSDGPIRTADGDPVGRVALYQVAGGVAVPVTSLGGSVSEQVTAIAPLVATPSGDNVVLSITTDQAEGVPLLDGSGLIKMSQMPISGLNYHGNWDASSNTPPLADGTGTAGDFYRVSVAGAQDLGSGSLTFAVGDHVIYEGGTWQRFVPPSQTAWGGIVGTLADQVDLQAALDAKVTTPDPLIPQVVLGTSLSTNTLGLVGYDQDALGDTLVMRQFGGQISTATPQADGDAATKAYVDDTVAAVPAAPVTSVNTHTGAVVLAASDVGAVPVAGGTVTGAVNIATSADGEKLWLAKYTSGSGHSNAPTAIGAASTYLYVGGREYGNNGFGGVGFSYVPDTTAHPAVWIGWQETNTADHTSGDFIVATRNVSTNTAPTERLRITAAGDIAAATGYTPTAAQSLATKSYVDTAVAGVSGGSAAWGGITGTLSAQTDLQQVLDGKLALTSKATQTQAEDGTDDTRWMTPLGTAQAISHAQSAAGIEQFFSDYKTMDQVVDAGPTVVAFGPTPSATDSQSWSIDFNLYVSAASATTVTFTPTQQSGVTTIASGHGPAPNATDGAPLKAAASDDLTFGVDTSIRLIHVVVTAINVAQPGLADINLSMTVAGGVNVIVRTGTHTSARTLTTAS